MAAVIRIKRSTAGAAPSSLAEGELAYAEAAGAGSAGVLYVGASGATVRAIAGLGQVAPLASPALTGVPTAPTAIAATNTTQIATTAYVKSQSYLVGTGVGAGTYTKVAVSSNGLVTAGTTLSASDIPALTASKISDFDAQVRTSRLDQMASPTGNLSFNNQRLTNVAAPSSAQDATNKQWVESLFNGSDNKGSVRVATTGNVDLALAPDTVDDVALATDDLLLVHKQTDPVENGVYKVSALGTGADGVWVRADNADISAEVTSGLFVFVSEGTTYGGNGYTLMTPDPIVLDTDALTFTQTSATGQIIEGPGIGKTGNEMYVKLGTAGTPSGRAYTAGSIVYAATTSALDAVQLSGLVQGNGAGAPSAILPGTTANVTPNRIPKFYSSAPYARDSAINDNGTTVSVEGRITRLSRATAAPIGTANTVYNDAVLGSTDTVNTGMTIFGSGQTGIAFGDAASELSGQVRYQHSTDTLEFGTVGNIDWRMTVGTLTSNAAGVIRSGSGTLIIYGTTGLSLGSGGCDAGRGVALNPVVNAVGTVATGMDIAGTYTATANGDVFAPFSTKSSGIVCASVTYTGLAAYMFRLHGSNMTKSGTGTIDTAATIYIGDAPSIGTSNYALQVASGRSVFGGFVSIGTTAAGQVLTLSQALGGANSTMIEFQVGATAKGYIGSIVTASHVIAGSAVGDMTVRTEGGKILFSTDSGVTAHAALSGANFGIGTISPGAMTHIDKSAAGAEGPTLWLKNSGASTLGSAASIVFTCDGGGTYAGGSRIQVTNVDAGTGMADMRFFVHNAANVAPEVMRLTSNGLVAIPKGVYSQSWTANSVPDDYYVPVLTIPVGYFGAPTRGTLSVVATYSGAVTQATYALSMMGGGRLHCVSMISYGDYSGLQAGFDLYEMGQQLGAGSTQIAIYNFSGNTCSYSFTLTLDNSYAPTTYTNPTPVAGVPASSSSVGFGNVLKKGEFSNVGIGTVGITNSALAVFATGADEVAGDPRLTVRIGDAGGGKGGFLGYSNSEKLLTIMSNEASSGVNIWTHNGSWGERFRVHTNGFVGIGTVAPIDRCEVAGGIHTSGAATASKANAAYFDYYSGGARIGARGPNDTTRATFKIDLMEGDAGNQITPISVDASGNVTLAPATGYLSVNNAGYAHEVFTVPAGGTYYLHVDMNGTNGYYEAKLGGYGAAGESKCVMSWIDGGHSGGIVHHHIQELARIVSGTLVLGQLQKTATGASILIQNTGSYEVVFHLTTMAFHTQSRRTTVTVNETPPSGPTDAFTTFASKVGVGTIAPEAALHVVSDALGVTQTNASGVLMSTTTAAVLDAQQISPAIRWRAYGWDTVASASKSVDFRQYVLPVQAAGNPTGRLITEVSLNGGGYSTVCAWDSDGVLTDGTIDGGTF